MMIKGKNMLVNAFQCVNNDKLQRRENFYHIFLCFHSVSSQPHWLFPRTLNLPCSFQGLFRLPGGKRIWVHFCHLGER